MSSLSSIQVKRQGGGESCTDAALAPSAGSLKYGELACASNGDLYVRNGSGNVVGVITTNGNKTISGPIIVNSTITANQFSGYLNGSADQLDGYHENSFFRYRDTVTADQTSSLWSQIGSRQYNGCLPDGLSGLYSWGQTISFAGVNARLDIYCAHTSSSDGNLWYRSGWDNDQKPWRKIIDSANIGSQNVNSATYSNILNVNNSAGLSACLQYIQTASQTPGNDLPSSTWYHVLKMNHGNGGTYYKRLLAFGFWGYDIYTSYASGNGVTQTWKRVWVEGNSVTGAVYNDYAECRESDTNDFGYVLKENGDDTLSKTTERLSPFAGISSDTWGFSQGETSKAKTPIAVAGRVLAYPYQDRNKYKPGDCVCAAPDGKVDIMTREEIQKYPDRIVGTVSCVPEYEEWGDGDRGPVKVNGRIWIKVK